MVKATINIIILIDLIGFCSLIIFVEQGCTKGVDAAALCEWPTLLI